MSPRELIAAFRAAMQANEWDQAARHLAPDCVVDWPCSGERIVGRDDIAELQVRYPSNAGHWRFDVHRLMLDGEQITRQVEYWPSAYEPVPGREDLTRPTERIS